MRKIYVISHEEFQTDRIGTGESYVKAFTKKEALKIYNEFAKRRKKFPYCWNEVILDHVSELKILNY